MTRGSALWTERFLKSLREASSDFVELNSLGLIIGASARRLHLTRQIYLEYSPQIQRVFSYFFRWPKEALHREVERRMLAPK